MIFTGQPSMTVIDRATGQTTVGDQPRPATQHAATTPRVRLAGPTLAWSAPGGGETQLAELAGGLQAQGLDARPWRPWEDAWSEIDVLHLLGSSPAHLPLVAAARRQGIAVVLSPIAWFGVASAWGESRRWSTRLRALVGLGLRAALPCIPSWRRTLYQAVDRLLPNSQAEADQLQRLFSVQSRRIAIVPNGARPEFARADAGLFTSRVCPAGFVLSVGRLEPRKNQLRLIRSLAGSGLRLVLIGQCVPGHEAYARACRRAADERVTFLPRLAHDDPLLASAYAAAGCLALPSWFETPGLVALEAALTGTPLVLTSVGAAREYFGPLATYVPPSDEAAIRRGVILAASRHRDGRLAQHVLSQFTWPRVAERTAEVYASL